ncbi:MAG: hypothetical protein N3D17_05430, partial [bacterium]|nr:hypothetical protein [bacterium]
LGDVYKRQGELLDKYKPVSPVIGVFFEPANYFSTIFPYSNISLFLYQIHEILIYIFKQFPSQQTIFTISQQRELYIS